MFPVLVKIGPVTLYTFGLMVMIAFLGGAWFVTRELKRRKIQPDHLEGYPLIALLGGIVGAKLYYAVSFYLIHGDPFWASMLSRGGLVFYGGFIGGGLAGYVGCRIWNVPAIPFANSAAISLSVGQAIGRIGCFLVGDDYGRASDLPWAVAFPNGLPPVHYPVHPTMLYETIWLTLVSIFLWSRRKRSPSLFGEFMILNGIGRAVIEHWRLNARVALDLSEAQWIGMGLVVFGIVLWVRAQMTGTDQPEAASSRS